MNKELKQVIVIRTDLNMPKGKIGGQVAHASGMFMRTIILHGIPPTEKELGWLKSDYTKTVVKVKSEDELLDLYEKSFEAGFVTYMVVDKGLTMFNGVPTKTCFAIGPDFKEEIDKITGHLPLL